MAFPAIQDADTTNGAQTSNSTSWTGTYPANIANGDLLLLMVGADGGGQISSLPSGWVTGTGAAAQGSTAISAAYKPADGTETGTFTITMTASEQGCWRIYRITGGQTSPVDPTMDNSNATDSTQNPDPANCDVSLEGAAEDILWVACTSSDGTVTGTGIPTNYTNSETQTSGGAGGAGLHVARRNLNANQENAGTFTLSATEQWAAFTIAIRPAAPPAERVPYFAPYVQLLPQ